MIFLSGPNTSMHEPNMFGWYLFLAVMVIYAVASFLGRKTPAKPVANKPIALPNSKVEIESVQNGSVKINATKNKTIIRLSGGAKFRGRINGKDIELTVPSDKTWEEFVIET